MTPRDLESYKIWRRSEGNSEQTVNNHLKDLQALYNRAAKMGFFTGANPVIGVERYKVTKQLVTFHTEEQLLRLLDVASKENPTCEFDLPRYATSCSGVPRGQESLRP